MNPLEIIQAVFGEEYEFNPTELMRLKQVIDLAARNRLEWQPIETAPRDGTHIIVFSPLIDHLQETWWVDDEDKWSNWDFIAPPTYWMPMPELPEED